MTAPVAIAACKDYHTGHVLSALREVCSSIVLPEMTGRRVLIKPNILKDTPPDRAVTTHPEVVRAMITIVRELGGIPLVGDSPAIQLPGFVPELSGIAAVCRDTETPWLDFTKNWADPSRKERGRGSRRSSDKFQLTDALSRVDMVISLPKMKTHQLMHMTGAVKNLFGLVPGLAKSPYHMKHPTRERFADMLLDLLLKVRPVLSIMDAVIAMEGPGPNAGTPKYIGAIIGSVDALSVDITAASIMGYEPERVPLFSRAIHRGMIHTADIVHIPYPLLHPDRLRPVSYDTIDTENRRSVISILTRVITGRRRAKRLPGPVFHDLPCIACSQCVRICPVKALTLQKDQLPKITIAYDICIRCYCCHEICPADAITIPKE